MTSRNSYSSDAQLTLLDEAVALEEGFSPLHVTFTGGAAEPFNRWFPYLEGYSPEFVRAVLGRYAPSARSVLDPFGGTATTAFVAAEMGLAARICEVNPVMRRIFDAKVSVRLADRRTITATRGVLESILGDLTKRLRKTRPDVALRESYAHAFGTSVYFSEETFDQVLRTRTLVDEVAFSNSIAGELLSVAAIAALLPSSYLKRAGDVRYMTDKERAKGVPKFIDEFARCLSQIIQDIKLDGYRLDVRPTLLCADARDLNRVPVTSNDALITSPPYINGTNYFRNTRLELWFLRYLRSKADLSGFRKLAITGGINDVSVSKVSVPHHPAVESIVRQLEANAYDARIPRMVASYFSELSEVFRAARRHLVPGALVAIDIGDSNYGGVHVPADELIRECLEAEGYRFIEDVFLRPRRSKNGAELKQVLLVFENTAAHPSPDKPATDGWKEAWRVFKDSLPHQSQPFTRRNWGSGLHSLCSYPGKLKPAIAHHLVATFVPDGGAVLDPFSGVGTIPFEAALTGRHSFGIDLSPAAYAVTAAKLTISKATQTDNVINQLECFIDEYTPTDEELDEVSSFGLNKRIVDYYHPDTLREVLAARSFFAMHRWDDPSTALVLASTLHVLHGNRPYAVSRRSHPLTPYAPTGDFEYRSLMARVRDKVARSLREPIPAEFTPGTALYQDATAAWPDYVNELDAVITSPPFFDSTRFHTQNWLRLWFSGWTPEMFSTQPAMFVDERQKDGFEVYESILRQARERLKPGGVFVLHLGKSVKCDMASKLLEVAKPLFGSSDFLDESVAHCESHGLRDKGTVTSHQYLVLY